MTSPLSLSGQFPGRAIATFLNEKRRQESVGGGGGVSDSWLDVRKRGGGSFRCVLCTTREVGGGGSKHRGEMLM